MTRPDHDGKQAGGEPSIKAGDYVHVLDGPLTGVNGRVDYVDRDGHRALIYCGSGRAGGLQWAALRHCWCALRPLPPPKDESEKSDESE
jgi:hypothetical protein